MSSTFIVGLIIAVLCCLMGYAFIFQSAERDAQRRQRLESAFKQQLSHLISVMESAQDGLLNRDLLGLLYHRIVDVSEQLMALDPQNENYSHTHSRYQKLLTDLKKIEEIPPPMLSSNEAVQQAQRTLKLVHGVIESLQKQKKLSQQHAQQYSSQIKEALLQTSIEECFLMIKTVLDEENYRLAILYYQHAIDLLTKENSEGKFDEQILVIKEKKASAEEKILIQQQTIAAQRNQQNVQSKRI